MDHRDGASAYACKYISFLAGNCVFSGSFNEIHFER